MLPARRRPPAQAAPAARPGAAGSAQVAAALRAHARRLHLSDAQHESARSVHARIAALLAMRRRRWRRVQLPIISGGALLVMASIVWVGTAYATALVPPRWATLLVLPGVTMLSLALQPHDVRGTRACAGLYAVMLLAVALNEMLRALQLRHWRVARACFEASAAGRESACARGAISAFTIAGGCAFAGVMLHVLVRGSLARLWHTAAVAFGFFSAAMLADAAIDTEVHAYHVASGVLLAALAVLTAAWPALRPRLSHSVFKRLDGISAAAGIAELLNGVKATDVLQAAANSFRAVRMDEFLFEHILPASPAPAAPPKGGGPCSTCPRVPTARARARVVPIDVELGNAALGDEAVAEPRDGDTERSGARSNWSASGVCARARSPMGTPRRLRAATVHSCGSGSGSADDVPPCVEFGAGAFIASQRAALGGVDAFVSHSWHDDPVDKWEALQAWRAEFLAAHKREPHIWFDRCCIDQADITAQLPSLPVYLAGCNTLLVLLGPTYLQRLWCVVELFVFYQTHLPEPPEGRTHFVTLRDRSADARSPPSPGAPDERGRALREVEATRCTVLSAARQFDVREASATLADDQARLLAVIEGSGEGFDEFNAWTRSLVIRKVEEDTEWRMLDVGRQQRWTWDDAGAAGGHGSFARPSYASARSNGTPSPALADRFFRASRISGAWLPSPRFAGRASSPGTLRQARVREASALWPGRARPPVAILQHTLVGQRWQPSEPAVDVRTAARRAGWHRG
ncbi:hypothetical protein KFE25_002799 [Diacronema lutheri]|uniref:Uncharacterized protein n=1 Tax=Diacronema lutheri TaxID=2081491 RepID=A0A8J5XJH6_DIALT|nr:hypothetical protein KFE25_002799 [Diacronema lutheri]